jgi:hypothetical protein
MATVRSRLKQLEGRAVGRPDQPGPYTAEQYQRSLALMYQAIEAELTRTKDNDKQKKNYQA